MRNIRGFFPPATTRTTICAAAAGQTLCSLRFCSSTNSDQTTEQKSSFDPAQQRLERSEHDSFIKFLRSVDSCTDHAFSTPKHLCSSARIDRERKSTPKAVQQAQGRGLVATADVIAGTVLASAPLLGCGIFADGLMRRAANRMSSNSNGKSKSPYELRDAIDNAWQCMPPLTDISRVAFSASGIQDSFVAAQAQLALCLALERCDEESPYKAYFETLPHPAVDDKLILELFKDFFGEENDIYGGHCTDYFRFISGLEVEWRRNAGGDAAIASNTVLVPPISLLVWAWRTVLARQQPMPLYGKPRMSKEDRATYGMQTHFLNWVMINSDKPEAMLFPTLLPFFELVDHGPVANVRIDVVTREIDSVAWTDDRSHELTPQEVKAAVDAAKGRTASANPSVSLFSRFKSATRDALGFGTNRSRGFKGETAAFVELQALSDLTAGTELQMRMTVDEPAFAVYRYGFYPMTFDKHH